MESVEGGESFLEKGGAPPRFALPSTGSPPLLFPGLSAGGEAARREFLSYEGPFPDTVRRRLTFAGEKPYCAVFPLYHRTKHEMVYAQGSGCSGSARGRRASGGVVRRNDRERAARYGGYGNGAGRQESMEAHPPSDVALVRLVPCHHYTGLSYPDTADRA